MVEITYYPGIQDQDFLLNEYSVIQGRINGFVELYSNRSRENELYERFYELQLLLGVQTKIE